MTNLKEYFDEVQVINLLRFPERWEQFKDRAEGSLITGFDRFEAIEGDKVNPPDWWRAGNGAWGCLMSHLHIAQRAIMNDARSLLVFEDDVMFRKFGERLPAIMAEAGDDWDMLYFGGQHLDHHGRPWKLEGKKEIIHGYNINRTHAFAVNGRFLVKYAQHIIHAPDYLEDDRTWHIDHQLGYLHEPFASGGGDRFRILCAYPWVCGQAAGKSWTSGKQTGANWWDIGKRQVRPSSPDNKKEA